jgi:hypothetical protein
MSDTAAERFWSPSYIQHSAHIEPGRGGLFNLIKAAPASLRYDPGVILAEGEHVIVHGRSSNIGLPVNWIAALRLWLNRVSAPFRYLQHAPALKGI